MFIEIKSMPGIKINENAYDKGDNMRICLYGLSDVFVRKNAITFTFTGPSGNHEPPQYKFTFSEEAMGEYYRIKKIIDEKTIK